MFKAILSGFLREFKTLNIVQKQRDAFNYKSNVLIGKGVIIKAEYRFSQVEFFFTAIIKKPPCNNYRVACKKLFCIIVLLLSAC